MSIIKEDISVEVFDIKIDAEYYSFKYIVTRNGKRGETKSYDSDHGWGKEFKAFEKLLKQPKNNICVDIVLELI